MKKIIALVLGLATIALAISTYLSISKGGVSFVLEVTANPDNKIKVENKAEMLNKCCEILSKRCNYAGATEVKTYPQEQEGDRPDKIRIELQGIKDTERIKELLTSSVRLGFWETYAAREIQPCLITADTKLRTLLADSLKDKNVAEKEYPLFYLLQFNADNNTHYPIIGHAALNDTATINKYLNISEIQTIFPKDLRLKWSASPVESDHNQKIFELYAIRSTQSSGKAPLEEDVIIDAECVNDHHDQLSLSITMDAYGARQWEKMTKQNIGRSIAIVLNNHVYSAPTVNSEITGGKSQITGKFLKEEAENLVYMLKSSALPASIQIVESTIIPDSQWSLNKYLLIGTLICALAFIFILIKRKE